MNINIRDFVSSITNKISIEKLNKIGIYEDKYRQLMLNTSPLDKEKAAYIINKMYVLKEYSTPTIYFVDSPKEANKLYKKLDAGRLNNNIDLISTLDDFENTAAFDFFENETDSEFDMEKLIIQREFTLNLHKVALYDEAAIIVDRPIVLSVDNTFNFHNLSGPSISYRGGNDSGYYIHGIKIKSQFIEDQEKITFDEIVNFKSKLSLLKKDDIEDETVDWLVNNFGEIFNEFH